MLTHNDYTVSNAYEVFDNCKFSKAKYWGFKDKGLQPQEMKDLFAYMKKYGKTTFLEVVEYTEQECLDGANLARYCECDILMGTKYFDSVNEFCKKHNIKYMPFAGSVINRPSILTGNIDDIVRDAQSYIDKGVYGIDLLGYRYTGDAIHLNKSLVDNVNAPVCIAGSIDSFQRLDEVKALSPWAFTIGSAFFENKFSGTFEEQINKVCDYINQ